MSDDILKEKLYDCCRVVFLNRMPFHPSAQIVPRKHDIFEPFRTLWHVDNIHSNFLKDGDTPRGMQWRLLTNL